MIAPASLRRMRRLADLSQEQLAEALGVNPSFVSLVESGKRRLKAERLYLWVEACGGQIVIVSPGEESGPVTEEERRLVNGWRRLGPDQQGVLRRLYDVLPVIDDRDLAHILGAIDVAAGGRRRVSSGGTCA